MAQTTIAPDGAILTEIFTAQSRAEVFTKMDERLAELKSEGHVLTHRRAIGRNTPCPCGSGRKYKKCCIAPAALVGPARSR